jgi:hypothetical protein
MQWDPALQLGNVASRMAYGEEVHFQQHSKDVSFVSWHKDQNTWHCMTLPQNKREQVR